MNIKDSNIAYMKFRLRRVKTDLEELYETLESNVIWSEINVIDEVLSMLEKPKKERNHCYCKDCAFFCDAKQINNNWYKCEHSKYIRGTRAGEYRSVMRTTYKCKDFIPLGESVEYHKGIKDLLNNITINESEEKE